MFVRASCGCSFDSSGDLTLCEQHQQHGVSVLASAAKLAAEHEPEHRCIRTALLHMYLGSTYSLLGQVNAAIERLDMIEARRLLAAGQFEILELMQAFKLFGR